MPVRFTPPFRFAAAALLCAALVGCRDEPDAVAVYTVPTVGSAEVSPTLPDAPFLRGMGGPVTPGEPQRLLGAIVTLGDDFWFFKLAGPTGTVAGLEPAFRDWLGSVAFDGGEPAWDAPDGWEPAPGNEFRHATLVAPGGTEATVTTFPVRGDAATKIEENFSRWRGQVGAPEGAGSVERLRLADDTPAVLFAVQSPGGVGGTGGSSTDAEPRAAAVPFRYELPDGWADAPASPMERLAFTADDDGDDGDAAKVSVLRFPAGSMSAEQVAGIWRGQEETGPFDPAADVEPLTVGDLEAPRIRLPPAEPGGRAVLGTTATVGDALWLFKLAGSEDRVAAATPAFERFLAGLSFPTPDSDAGDSE